jgi:hypothetical protein
VRITGRVQSVGTTSLVVQTRRGNVTANVSDRTWIVVPENGRCVEGDLGDIRTGEIVAVAGMTAGQGTINSRVIAQGRCARGSILDRAEKAVREVAKHVGAGTIKAISGSTITLTNAAREVTIKTTADTVVFNNGFQPVSSLKVGDKVQVLGKPDRPVTSDNKTLTAWAIRVENSATRFLTGQVRSVSGNTVTLGRLKDRNDITITLDSNTAYKLLSVTGAGFSLPNAAQADIKVGTNLQVEGVPSADGKSLAARAVVILPGVQNRPARP